MAKPRRQDKSEDPLVTFERENPDLLSMEKVLREAASKKGNIQDEPYQSGVNIAVDRMRLHNENWSMPQARKNHKCDTCGCPIESGERYVRFGLDSFSSDKFCATCAARYLLEMCEVHRYSAPYFGYAATHWSTAKQQWDKFEVEGRTSLRWRPPRQITNKVLEAVDTEITQVFALMEASEIPGYDPMIYVPWLAVLRKSALREKTQTSEDQIWALNLAIRFAQSIGISRWTGIRVSRDFSGQIYCLGCGQNITYDHIFRLYGEETDFLCVNCSIKTILTERTAWVIERQKSAPYFWDGNNGRGTSQQDLTVELLKNYQRQEQAREYQKKVDSGMTIHDIANLENRSLATIKQKLKNLGVVLNKP